MRSQEREIAERYFKEVGVSARLLFIDGRWLPEHSNLEALRSHLRLLPSEESLSIEIAKSWDVSLPIHLLHLTSGGTEASPSLRLSLEEGARACVIESYAPLATPDYRVNGRASLSLGKGAVLEHVRLQRESLGAAHEASIEVIQADQSLFSSRNYALGGAKAKCQLTVSLDGEGAECELTGLSIGRGLQRLETLTRIDHAQPNCVSRELYKGVFGETAHGSFIGRIIVRPGANGTQASQGNPNLLLGEAATVETRPELEIFADEVKCNHGATVGRLNEEALFYLRARGLEGPTARRLLVRAFANEVVEPLSVAAVRSLLFSELERRLEGAELESA